MSTPIPIFYACDDRFAPYMVVSLCSMLENCSKQRDYRIHILNTGISEEIKKIVSAMRSDNVEVCFENVSKYMRVLEGKLPIRDYYTKTTYYRLFIADMFPYYDKALYLDSDTVILGDVAELFDTDIGDNYVAAAHEQAMLQVEAYGHYVEQVCGIDRHAYFNAGILLINTDMFRKKQILSRFANLLKVYNFRVTQDEDYLNVLCKDRVLFLDSGWNMEVLGELPCTIEQTKIIHFIMTNKPWHYRDSRLKEYFWQYAEKTPVYNQILSELENYTPEQMQNDLISCEKLEILAADEADRTDSYWAEELKKRAPDRVAVLRKIAQLESDEIYDVDVEEDPPTKPIRGNVDYCKKRVMSRIKARFAFAVAKSYLKKLLKRKKFILKGIEGVENLSSLKSGAIITCNHFNAFDSFAIHMAYDAAAQKQRKFFRVIREGNYTSYPGLYGFFMRNCNTLPLSQSYSELKKFSTSVDKLLAEGHFILVYPEKSMWWNYRKPRPLKSGAFRFAVRNAAPVVPCFITLRDSDIVGSDGFPVQEYTVHIEKPIYPETDKPAAEQIQTLLEQNQKVWKDVYERTYGFPLALNK